MGEGREEKGRHKQAQVRSRVTHTQPKLLCSRAVWARGRHLEREQEREQQGGNQRRQETLRVQFNSLRRFAIDQM